MQRACVSAGERLVMVRQGAAAMEGTTSAYVLLRWFLPLLLG